MRGPAWWDTLRFRPGEYRVCLRYDPLVRMSLRTSVAFGVCASGGAMLLIGDGLMALTQYPPGGHALLWWLHGPWLLGAAWCLWRNLQTIVWLNRQRLETRLQHGDHWDSGGAP